MELAPGESIPLYPGTVHAVRGHGGDVVVGEVSSVNDDAPDNFFSEALARLTDIDGEEPACRPLSSG